MIVGVIGAMNDEIDFLLNSLENVSDTEKLGMHIYKAEINDNEVYIVKCGVGKVNASIAATVLALEYGCELLINTGIAGGVAPLHTRDIVLAKSLSYNDVDVTAFGYKYGEIPGMPHHFVPRVEDTILVKKALNKLNLPFVEANVYSGDQFVSSFDQLKHIDEKGFACEMEGAAIAHTAVKCGVGFIVLRFISDIVGEPSQINDYATFEHEMATKSASICLMLLNNL